MQKKFDFSLGLLFWRNELQASHKYNTHRHKIYKVEQFEKNITITYYLVQWFLGLQQGDIMGTDKKYDCGCDCLFESDKMQFYKENIYGI